VVREFLQQLFGPGQKHLVKVTRGQVTSELRYRWGLNSILSPDGNEKKNRLDHRHHAVDAVVIALTTAKHVHNLAHREDFRLRGQDFPPPAGWRNKEAFREEIGRVIDAIKVSWKPLRHVRGELHEATNYGQITGKAARGEENVFIRRKPLDAKFSKASAEKIQDERIRELVLNRLAEHGDDPKKAFVDPLFLPNRRGAPVLIRRVRVREVMTTAAPLARRGESQPYRWVKPGSNHHIAIFEKSNGKRFGVVVTMHEAAQRVLRGQLVIERTCLDMPQAKFCYSLSLNEVFRLEEQANSGLYRVQQISASPRVVLRPITLAVLGRKDAEPLLVRRSPSTLIGRKVVIDPLGREFPAHD
jgi:CRISPR-associated endonuclease Csn1